ncbi:Uncharacterised protein [Agrobacterium tumefaciens]|nr:Uncharacterised protein [Agrobacterium tumefaciens]
MLFQNRRLSARKSRQAGDQPVQRVNGGEIGDAIHQSRAEMPLESSHGAFGFFAISACYFNAITINGQHRLQRFDRLAMVPALKKRPPRIGAGSTQWPTPCCDRMSHGNFSPGSTLRIGATSECANTLSGAIFQRWPQSRHNSMTASICFFGNSGRPPGWPWLAISIPIERELMSSSPRPGTFARMPGTAGFRHELDDAPVLEDEIMAGDLAFGIAEP